MPPEIDAYENSLENALSEVARIRAHEETRLAGRISEATAGFQQALNGLHKQYLEQVCQEAAFCGSVHCEAYT